MEPTTARRRTRRKLRRVHALAVLALVSALLAPLATTSETAAAEDEITQALTMINTYRSWLGLPPMQRNPALDAAASAHAAYYQANFGDPSLAGMGLHAESPDKPGFTGEDMQDRADAQGYGGWVNENIGLSGSMVSSVSWFIATINHRVTLIDPRYTEIGFCAVNNGDVRIEVIDVGAPTWSNTATPDWVAWPPDHASGVGVNFWGEAPNPFPSADYPTGYPITLKYHGPGTVTFQQASLTANGQEVPVIATTGTGWLTRNTYQIAATTPLESAQAYTVHVRGNVDGTPFDRSWSFRTVAEPGEPLALDGALQERSLPPGVAAADPAVQDVWRSQDGPVHDGTVARTWLWGPDTFASTPEPYAEGPGGKRDVYYFDKTRMELNDPTADRSSPWFVTNGLLVRDMILGAVQTGDAAFAPASPASVPLAGDPQPDNPDAPTYASLNGLAAIQPGRELADRTGQPVEEVLTRDGTVSGDPALGGYTTLARYDPVTGRNIATVFADWLDSQSWDALYVVGRPLSEPYWVHVSVDGTPQWVLVQAFERRVLTFTPTNEAGWQIEMGNVGQHYYVWRYGALPGVS